MDILTELKKIDKIVQQEMKTIVKECNNAITITGVGVGRLLVANEALSQENVLSLESALDITISQEKIDWDSVKVAVSKLFKMVINAIKSAYLWLKKQVLKLYKRFIDYAGILDKSYYNLDSHRKTTRNTIKNLQKAAVTGPMEIRKLIPGVADFLDTNEFFIGNVANFYRGGESEVFTPKVILKLIKKDDLKGLILSEDGTQLSKPNERWNGKSIAGIELATYYQALYDLGEMIEGAVEKHMAGALKSEDVERYLTEFDIMKYGIAIEENNTILKEHFSIKKTSRELKRDVPSTVYMIMKEYEDNHVAVNAEISASEAHYEKIKNDTSLAHFLETIEESMTFLRNDEVISRITDNKKLREIVTQYLNLAGYATGTLSSAISRLRIDEAKEEMSHYKAMAVVLTKSYNAIDGVLGGDKEYLKLIIK